MKEKLLEKMGEGYIYWRSRVASVKPARTNEKMSRLIYILTNLWPITTAVEP